MNAPLALSASVLVSALCAFAPCAANSHAAISVRLSATPLSVLALDAFWFPRQYLDETPPVAGNSFGSSVRMAGDLLVVGVPYADNAPGPTMASGRAYIYRRIGGYWQFEKLLTAPTPQADAHFGLAVAVSTLTVPVVAIGEPDRNDANGDDVGYVWMYQYVNGAWQNGDVIMDSASGDRYGAALDVAGDFLVAGIPGWDASPMPQDQDVGLADVHKRCNPNPLTTTWCNGGSYLVSPLQTGARLGTALAITGEVVIIGAPYDSPSNVAGAGSAWIHNLVPSGGPLTTPIMLTDPTPVAAEGFGFSVAGAGSVFAVGSQVEDEPNGAASSGAVHVFALSGNTAPFEKTLRSPTPQFSAYFGSAVALTGNRIVIGEPFRDVFLFGDTLADAGAVHVFRRCFVPSGYTWANVTSVYNFLGEVDTFGSAVATVDGTQFAAGSPNRAVNAQASAGEVTIYWADLVFADDFDI